ncbi:AraC family transcriptional regulator [Propionibacteriaceae bacterium Y2011]|uniref:AraC family transcriptional regulator n=1 Tax=Microlunatus sp. Y2014 TaxID=3418488 RepID=UPI003B4A4179
MQPWTKPTTPPGPTGTGQGILRPAEHQRVVLTRRFPCADSLAAVVENYWWLEWSLPAGESYPAQTLPHPTCHLTVERGRTRPEVTADPVVVTGLVTKRFDVDISGAGWVWGVKFRPGGLAAVTGRNAKELRDRVVPAADLLPATVVEPLRHLGAGAGTPEPATDLVDRTDEILAPLAKLAAGDARYAELLTMISEMLTDRDLIRTGQLEQRWSITERSLQRLFERYVGVGPKWVLARYRMHDVVAELDRGYDGSMADLAATYGWYDQAHFVRDFTRLVGVPPSRYRSRR